MKKKMILKKEFTNELTNLKILLIKTLKQQNLKMIYIKKI